MCTNKSVVKLLSAFGWQIEFGILACQRNGFIESLNFHSLEFDLVATRAILIVVFIIMGNVTALENVELSIRIRGILIMTFV